MHPLALLIFALQSDASRVLVVPMSPCVRKARVRKQRMPRVGGRMPVVEGSPPSTPVGATISPKELPQIVEFGELILTVPVPVARQFEGPVEDRDVLLIVTVPRDVYEAAKSPIIRSGATGAVNGTILHG